MKDVWILVQLRQGTIEEFTGGLIAEARRLAAAWDTEGHVTAVVLGPAPETDLAGLGAYGVARVLHVQSSRMIRYQGEVFARCLGDLIRQHSPICLLMVQTPNSDDLAQRLAALLETGLVRRAVDFTIINDSLACAVRPVANGYLFEEVQLPMAPLPIVTFSPSVLFDVQPDGTAPAPVIPITSDVSEAQQTTLLDVIEAAPEDLDLEESDIIVAGGRGVGKDDAFSIVYDLARAMNGSVGGTRPIIDWGTLPYARQIGQTGKYVSPRLIINCGISGANEYTAGMEKSQHIIAIDQNPLARIFRFADLGVVGDVHILLPLLTERLAALQQAIK
jgi:electron transfer flavoprotein alpha subunit